MNLPNALRIGNKDYAVIPEERPFVDNGDALDGQIRYADCQIWIWNTANDQHVYQTLLHEAVHGICRCFDVDLSDDDVDRMAHGISMLLRDNAEFFAKYCLQNARSEL